MSDVTLPLAYAEPKATAKTFVSHAKVIGAITFLSRLLGMARESIAANYFGGGMVYSAFQFAFTVPNLFRKLLGEGALSAAFIPLYAQAVKRETPGSGFRGQGSGDANTESRTLNPEPSLSANDFAAASVNLLCTILLVLTIVGELRLVRHRRTCFTCRGITCWPASSR